MRLLVLNYEFPPLGGGAGNATAALAREWAERGHDVEILTGGFRGLPRVEQRDGYTVRRLRTPRAHQGQCSVAEMVAFMTLSCLPTLARGSTFQPDVTIAFFSIPSAPAAWLLRLLRGTPYVVSLRGGDVPAFDEKNLAGLHQLTAPLTSLLWRNAAAVVANSAGLRETAARFANDPPILEIPNGVDTVRFAPRPHPRSAGPVELLFVGRLVRQKGVDVLLDALAQCRATNWRLTIVGDGPERAAFTAQAARLGLADRVYLPGWAQREALPELYRQADVFVFPSLDEGMPNVVLEAMASGLPIVATRIAGSEQLVRENDNGLLAPPGEAAPLAAALEPVLGSAPLRATMGARSRALTLSHHSWSGPAEEYLALFEKIVAEQKSSVRAGGT